MERLMSANEIRDYWMQQAIAHGQSHAASWPDIHAINLEIHEISKYLQDNDKILEVGCANGFTTIQYASAKKLEILGIDYIAEMIKSAQQRVVGIEKSLKGKVDFSVGNVLNLNFPPETFDKVISTRVIINLGDWPNQLIGLNECGKVLKRNGILLLSEATVQGWQRMNSFRREWGLPDIPVPSFNNYIDEEKIVESLSDKFELEQISNFASTYFVGTRVLKPLLAKIAENKINVADPLMEFNRWVAQLPSSGDYGTQKLLVFRKK